MLLVQRRQTVPENVVEGQPEGEAGALADEHEEGAAAEVELVEAEAYGEDVADKWQPCQEGQQGAVFVYLRFLFQQGLFLDTEPLLYPFPFAYASYPVGCQAAEPVAGSGADPGYQRVPSGYEDAYDEKIR